MAYYDRYRGSRRRKRNRIKIILLILLLLVVIGLAALFLLQDAVIFTSNGFHIPFGSQQKDVFEDPPMDPDDIHLEIEAPQPGGQDVLQSGQSDTQQPQLPIPAKPAPVVLEQTAALLLDGTSLLADRADVLRRISEGGYVQMALQVKTPDGIALVDDGTVKDGLSPDSEAFLQALEGVELPKIAVISALRDNVRPRTGYRGSALHTSSGATWLDREYISWFDPAGKDTLECLVAMIEACKATGFEQVVLENFHYPNAGKLELIDYSDTPSRQSALTELARQLQEAVDLPLGLMLTEAASSDLLDSTSGQDVAELAQYFDIVYVPAADFTADLSAVEGAVEDTECRVGLLLNEAVLPPVGSTTDYIVRP